MIRNREIYFVEMGRGTGDEERWERGSKKDQDAIFICINYQDKCVYYVLQTDTNKPDPEKKFIISFFTLLPGEIF